MSASKFQETALHYQNKETLLRYKINQVIQFNDDQLYYGVITGFKLNPSNEVVLILSLIVTDPDSPVIRYVHPSSPKLQILVDD